MEQSVYRSSLSPPVAVGTLVDLPDGFYTDGSSRGWVRGQVIEVSERLHTGAYVLRIRLNSGSVVSAPSYTARSVINIKP